VRTLYCVNYRHLLSGQWGRAFVLSKDKIEALRNMLAGGAGGTVSVHPGYTKVGLNKLSFEELELGLVLVETEIHAWERTAAAFHTDDLARKPEKEIKDLQEFGREMFEIHDEKMRKERQSCQVDGIGNGAPASGIGERDFHGVG